MAKLDDDLLNFKKSPIYIILFILYIALRLFGHAKDTEHKNELNELQKLKPELDAAVKSDDWNHVKLLYQKCKIPEDKKYSLSAPDNCDPVILIHGSIKAKARKVYHGIANDPQFKLSSNWRENEAENFRN